MSAASQADLERPRGAWAELEGATVTPLERGLINATFRARGPAGRFILQRVNPMFPAEINENVHAVTEHLAAKGLATPRLVPTVGGRGWLDLGDDGVWRLLTHVEGASFDTARSLAQVRAAGALAGRFHAALADLEHRFVARRAGGHDLGRHRAALAAALERHRQHRLHARVAILSEELMAAFAELPAPDHLVRILGHGDLKLNNVRFAGEAEPERDRAVCLLDLDTVGPIPLAFELGDAWRSWCNPAGEDGSRAIEFDLAIFAASLDGYLEGCGRPLAGDERRQLLYGVEWIALELAMRFAADALEETYFGWDPTRHPGRGEHNLHRADIQRRLLRSARERRPERAERLGVSLDRREVTECDDA